MASILPRLPGNLSMIVLKKPTEANEDKSFRANRQHIMQALVYLKEKNEHYRDIEISLENFNAYPVDSIMQDIPSLNPDELGIPPEQPMSVNEESAREEVSTVDCPSAVNTILYAIQLALRENQESGHEPAAPILQWPERAQEPASEFILVYFSKAFPDLIPDNKGDLRMTRLGKNPSLKSYFRHLLRVRRDFTKHHRFVFVATNMIRHHEALSLGNVFAKKSADGLSMADLKALIAGGDDRVINKLVHFGSGIPETHQYLSHMSDQALAYPRFVCITSQDTEMFTFFQSFSAADLHWSDLHRLLPGSESYMGKRVVKKDIF
jgi:hypothetical protein